MLCRFRADFRACLAARGDELFELADAVLCADGPVRTLAGLSLAPGHRRDHGTLYDAVSHGRIVIGRLRRALAYFTQAELAEAFAATCGVASPTQLRAFMKRDPRDLLSEFRALAPHRPPRARA